jgi:hypothetical protein
VKGTSVTDSSSANQRAGSPSGTDRRQGQRP